MALNFLIITHKKISFDSLLQRWLYTYESLRQQIIVYDKNEKNRLLIEEVDFISDEFENDELEIIYSKFDNPILYSISFRNYDLMKAFLSFYIKVDSEILIDNNHGLILKGQDLKNNIDALFIIDG